MFSWMVMWVYLVSVETLPLYSCCEWGRNLDATCFIELASSADESFVLGRLVVSEFGKRGGIMSRVQEKLELVYAHWFYVGFGATLYLFAWVLHFIHL